MKGSRVLICLMVCLVGCLVLSACGGENGSPGTGNSSQGGGTASENGPQQVRVMMGDMYFKSDITTFKVGKPYRFVLVNEGKVEHEFTIAPPRKAGQTEEDLDKLSLLDADDLEPGKTKTIDFTFKDAAPPGTLEFECSYPGHYEGGMHIAIQVEQ